MDGKWAAVILLGTISAGTTKAAEEMQVNVYVQQDSRFYSLGLTRHMTSDILKGIHVCVIWHDGQVPKSTRPGEWPIGIRLVSQAPGSVSEGALASARPYGRSGTLISVYTDRVRQLLLNDPNLWRTLIAYVFVHELAHVMQGNDYHSKSGILKASWGNADFVAIRSGRLGFEDGDSDRIRDAWRIRLAAK